MSSGSGAHDTNSSDSGTSTVVEVAKNDAGRGKKTRGSRPRKVQFQLNVPELTDLSESRQPVIPRKHFVHNKPYGYKVINDACRYEENDDYDVLDASSLVTDPEVRPLSVQVTVEGCVPLETGTDYPNLTPILHPVAVPQRTSLVPTPVYLRKAAPTILQLSELGDPITSVCKEFSHFSCSERIVLTRTVSHPPDSKGFWIHPAPRWFASKSHRESLEKGGTVQELAKDYHQFLPVSERPLNAIHLEPAHSRDCFCGACPSAAVQSPLVNPVLNLSLREPHHEEGPSKRIEEEWTLLTLNTLHERDQWSMRLRDYNVKLSSARCLEDVKYLYHLINRAHFCYEIARLLHSRSHDALTQLRLQIQVLNLVKEKKPYETEVHLGLLTILREDSQNYATRYLQDRMQLGKAYSHRFSSKGESNLLYHLVVRNLYPVITHGHGSGRPTSAFAKFSAPIPLRPALAKFPHVCAQADRGCDAEFNIADSIVELGKSSLEFANPSKLVGRSPDVTPPVSLSSTEREEARGLLTYDSTSTETST